MASSEPESSAAAKRIAKDDAERKRILAQPIPLGFVRSALAKDLESRKLTRDFIVYIPFIFFFMWFFLAHRDIEAEFNMGQGIQQYFVQELPPVNPTTTGTPTSEYLFYFKSFMDANNVGDWYDWVEAVVPAQLFVDNPTSSRRLAGQNIPIGALRIRSKHVRSDSCEPNSKFYSSDATAVCYAEYSTDSELATNGALGDNGVTFNFTGNCWGPMQTIRGERNAYPCGGFIVDIPFSTPKTEAIEIIKTLRTGDFARSYSVRILIIEFYTYSPPIDAFLSAKLFIEVAPGGGVMPQMRFRPFRFYENNAWWTFWNFCFLLYVIYYWGVFFVAWHRSYRLTQRFLAYIIDLWNLLELLNLVAFLVVFVFHWYWWALSANEQWKFPQTEEYPNSLDTVSEVFMAQAYWNAFSTVVVFLKILKFLRLNDRLNILTRTLEQSAQSILGVLVIFLFIVVAYALAGNFLYGTRMFYFRNMGDAFSAAFRMLIGQFDYDTMRRENIAITFFFFWSYNVLALFVMLNFVVAVVMQGFEQESNKVKHPPLAVAIKRTLSSIAVFFRTPGAGAAVWSTITAKRTPEETVFEYVEIYCATLKEKLHEAIDEDEDVDQEKAETKVLDETPVYRYTLAGMMPAGERELIGEPYIDNIWVGLFIEYEAMTKTDAERDVAELIDALFESTVEASANLFLPMKRAMFGDEVEAERSNTQELLRSKILLAHGRAATGCAEVVQDLESRVTIAEKRFMRMAELLDSITENLSAIQ